MRGVLGGAMVLGLSVAAYGVRLVVDQQREVLSYSAPTTATIVEKRLERHPNPIRGGHYYELLVRYRYEADGRPYTGDKIFPVVTIDRVGGGDLLSSWARGVLERFEVGQPAAAWYKPASPAEACLIRRPSLLHYGAILVPVMVVSGLVGLFWPARGRRKGIAIAVVWHLAGLAAAAHYFYLAQGAYAGAALVLFGVYIQLGLVPLVFVLPPAETSNVALRIKMAIWFSLAGTFAGFWLGPTAGKLLAWATGEPFVGRLPSIGYGMAAAAALFALLGLTNALRVKWGKMVDELPANPPPPRKTPDLPFQRE